MNIDISLPQIRSAGYAMTSEATAHSRTLPRIGSIVGFKE